MGRPLRRPPPRRGSCRPRRRTTRPVRRLTSHSRNPGRIPRPRSGRRPHRPPRRAGPRRAVSRRTRSCW
ncbi:hypothetical protein FAF44_51615 [Nonomuraea sp. MG754425]|nr:hypothetical protein [Nonomuraea sp. MG754425]